MRRFGKKNFDMAQEDRNPNRSADRWSAVSPTAQSAEAAQASGLRHSRPGGLRYGGSDLGFRI
jgi:hypothetical protein